MSGDTRRKEARFGPFVFDPECRQVRRDDHDIHLTPKAFDLLSLLIGAAPRVLKKTDLHALLWPDTFVSDATLTGLVKELRRALEDRDALVPLIRTAHGVGYAFTASPVWRMANMAVAWLVVHGRRVALSAGDNVIGRDALADVVLLEVGVSRRHARIVVGENRATVEDLGSKNGTRLRGQAVVGPAAMRDGDLIEVGPVLITFHVAATGMSTATVDVPRDRL